MAKFFETVIRVPMPEGSLAWGKTAVAIEPAFDALAKGLAKAGVEGVEITQREVNVKGPRAMKVTPPEAVDTSSNVALLREDSAA